VINPFDLKSALAAKHAQHVVLIHFPIALFIAGVAFDFFSALDETAKPGRGRLLQFSGGRGGNRANDDDWAARLAVATRGAAFEGHTSPTSGIRRCFQHVDLHGLANSLELEAKTERDFANLLHAARSAYRRAACAYGTPRGIP
jgi:hypothetical protein